jgi:hypothetical protein
LWVQYQSTVAAIVTAYTITSANDVPTRDPKDWNLAGSNDGVNWTVIDSRSGETFASRFLIKTYLINNNSTAYIYYRLNITSNNGNTGTQFAEWELFERRVQTISITDIPELTYGDEPFELMATSSSGLPVTVELVSGPAIVADSMVTITGAGEITLRFSQAGNDRYFPVTIEKRLTVRKAAQHINFEPVTGKTYGDAPFSLKALSDAGLPVLYEVVSGPANCSDALVNITGAGSITVRASQAGNGNYEPAVSEQTFTVNKASQLISFNPISPKLKIEKVSLTATTTAGLPVGFSVASGPGVINGSTLTFNGEGLVTVQAVQSGNDNYDTAQQVQQTILVLGLESVTDEFHLRIVPNPTHGSFAVRFNHIKGRSYSFTVIDNAGSIVARSAVPSTGTVNQVQFDITSKPNGFYFVHVTDGVSKVVRLVVKY